MIMEKKLSVLFDREGVSGKIELFNAGKADIEAFSLDGYRLDISVTDPTPKANEPPPAQGAVITPKPSR